MQLPIERAVAVLRQAGSVVVFTGAGVSAESGLATYRSGPDALWSAREFEQYANPTGYRAHLPTSFRWYRDRARAAADAQPNAAHQAAVRLAAVVRSLTVVTQNVDGLHIRAGSRDVIELHGSLREARCDGCGSRVPWGEASDDATCRGCGDVVRPDVVLFGELLDESLLLRARDLAAACDVLISVGTSNLVWPARELPLVALAAGASVIVVNTDLRGQPTGPRVVHLEGSAAAVMSALVSGVDPVRGCERRESPERIV